MMATHDVSKLPKWARERIELLERNLEHAEARLSVGPEDADTFARTGFRQHTPLGRETHVLFGVTGMDEFGGDDSFTVYYDAEGAYLEVRASPGDGRDGTIQVEPRAANVVWLRNRRFRAGDS